MSKKGYDPAAVAFLSDALADAYAAVQTATKRAQEQGQKRVRFDDSEEKALAAAVSAGTGIKGSKKTVEHFEFTDDIDFDFDIDLNFDPLY